MKLKQKDLKFVAIGMAIGMVLCLFFGSTYDTAQYESQTNQEAKQLKQELKQIKKEQFRQGEQLDRIENKVELNNAWLLAIMFDRGMLDLPHIAFDMAVSLAIAEAARLGE